MKVVVIPEPVLQPDITKEDMDLKWNLLKELPEVDELVISILTAIPAMKNFIPSSQMPTLLSACGSTAAI